MKEGGELFNGKWSRVDFGCRQGGDIASMTNIAAQGTIIDQSGLGSLRVHGTLAGPDDGHAWPSSLSPSLLDTRFVPTQPSTSVIVPLGRTKSQLTLLLERDQARGGSKLR